MELKHLVKQFDARHEHIAFKGPRLLAEHILSQHEDSLQGKRLLLSAQQDKAYQEQCPAQLTVKHVESGQPDESIADALKHPPRIGSDDPKLKLEQRVAGCDCLRSGLAAHYNAYPLDWPIPRHCCPELLHGPKIKPSRLKEEADG